MLATSAKQSSKCKIQSEAFRRNEIQSEIVDYRFETFNVCNG